MTSRRIPTAECDEWSERVTLSLLFPVSLRPPPILPLSPCQGDLGIPGHQGEIGFKGDKVGPTMTNDDHNTSRPVPCVTESVRLKPPAFPNTNPQFTLDLIRGDRPVYSYVFP